MGFPHSDMPGSKIAPISPGLFAGCHVLHRLLPPRHPPDALLLLHSSWQKQTRPKTGRSCLSSSGSLSATAQERSDFRHSVSIGIFMPTNTSLFTMSNSAAASAAYPSTGISDHPNLGGGERDRTDDLKLAKLALSQLSYAPDRSASRRLVGLARLELATSRLSGVRSNHLSYRPSRPGCPRRRHQVLNAGIKGYVDGDQSAGSCPVGLRRQTLP